MWRMLTGRAKDLEVELLEREADGERGSARWRATYTYSQTGRPVVNDVRGTFRFADGADRRARGLVRVPPLGPSGAGRAGPPAGLDADAALHRPPPRAGGAGRVHGGAKARDPAGSADVTGWRHRPWPPDALSGRSHTRTAVHGPGRSSAPPSVARSLLVGDEPREQALERGAHDVALELRVRVGEQARASGPRRRRRRCARRSRGPPTRPRAGRPRRGAGAPSPSGRPRRAAPARARPRARTRTSPRAARGCCRTSAARAADSSRAQTAGVEVAGRQVEHEAARGARPPRPPPAPRPRGRSPPWRRTSRSWPTATRPRARRRRGG